MEQRSGKKSLVITAIIMVVVLMLAFVGYRLLSGTQASQASQNSSAAPSSQDTAFLADYDCTVYTQGGSKTTLSAIADGKPLVINLWATWCPYCVDEMLDFQKLYERYGEQISFAMVDAVGTRNETVQKGAAYINQEGFTFPVFYDTDGEVVGRYQVTSFPSTIVYDGNGELVRYYIGRIDTAAVDDFLNSLQYGVVPR